MTSRRFSRIGLEQSVIVRGGRLPRVPFVVDLALRKAFRLLTGKSLADWRKANR